MSMRERVRMAKVLTIDLYNYGFIETLYNTQSQKHADEGWTLKNGAWSPWYLNLRPIGSNPQLVSDIAHGMNHMIRDEVSGLTQIMGIEMAGVPLTSAIATASGHGCKLIRYSYTRPIPGEKPRTPDEAVRMLNEMDIKFGYGSKSLVEGRFRDDEYICIVDDMVTNLGSKLIAQHLLEYELKGRGVTGVKTEHVAVVLDREQGGAQEAQKHGMKLHSLIQFKTHGLEWLKSSMKPEEYALIADYQKHPTRYMEEALQRKAIAQAQKIRGN